MKALTIGVLAVTLVLAALPVVAGTRPDQHAIAALRDISIEGNDIRVRGDVHGNSNVSLSGNVSVDGTAEAGGRVFIAGNARALRVVNGASAVSWTLDLGRFRQLATQVIQGDHTFRGLTVLRGTTYVTGNVIVDGVLTGVGPLVSERDMLIRGQRQSLNAIDLISGDRLGIQGSGLNVRGTVAARQWIEVSGNGISVTGTLMANEVRVRGSSIAIGGRGGIIGVINPPGVQPVGGAPTILQPREGTTQRGDAVTVSGTAPPGARVRITLRHVQTGQERSSDVLADGNGRFSGSVGAVAGPGDYVVIAQFVGVTGLLSQAAVVSIRLSEAP